MTVVRPDLTLALFGVRKERLSPFGHQSKSLATEDEEHEREQAELVQRTVRKLTATWQRIVLPEDFESVKDASEGFKDAQDPRRKVRLGNVPPETVIGRWLTSCQRPPGTIAAPRQAFLLEGKYR